MTDAEIQSLALAQLRDAITASGLSATLYARQVLIRDPRTVRRWLSGESPIPQSVMAFLASASMTLHSTAPQGEPSDIINRPDTEISEVNPDA